MALARFTLSSPRERETTPGTTTPRPAKGYFNVCPRLIYARGGGDDSRHHTGINQITHHSPLSPSVPAVVVMTRLVSI